MAVHFNQDTQTFHLYNKYISYIMNVLPNGQLGHLYFGKAVTGYGSFDYLLEPAYRPMASYAFEGDHSFSLEHVRQEYPSYGTGDFRHPAVGIRQHDGSRISDFRYAGHLVTDGKPALEGLPATYCEEENEAQTLHVFLEDPLTGAEAELLYTLFEEMPVLTRSARLANRGSLPFEAEQAMSLSLDLPDPDYEWIQLSGAWARERHIRKRRLEQGIQSVESTRGNSSHAHNPFVVLKREETTETGGEAIGFSLVYSGNFLMQAEVDAFGVTRFMAGINPFGFSWRLEPGETLQLPEAVMVYTDSGLSDMSRTFHTLYREKLSRGCWRDRARPILINSWECMGFEITEEKILSLARKARACGIELLVLDDGWTKDRANDRTGLGDWDLDRDVFPEGLGALSEKIRETGLLFGLWIEPEMLNRDSELFRKHPDWILQVPGRRLTHCRNEFVLDLTRRDVADHLFGVLKNLFERTSVSYVKWDMNRSITEAFSALLPAQRQGEVMHRYILGVYQLYERLIQAFPKVLFESCASGGGRCDPGMLYYAPQCWISDDSDAAERLKIQYGSSLCYPISSFGTHVSSSPNQQVHRTTPLYTRANTAFFGTFGYEMDLEELTEEELALIRSQVALVKQYRELIQKGTFYRLISPFDRSRAAAWMTVDKSKRTAAVGYYKLLNEVNGPFRRIRLTGLDPARIYQVEQTDERNRLVPFRRNACAENLFSRPSGNRSAGVSEEKCTEERPLFTGDELMKIGLVVTDSASGELRPGLKASCDFDSRLYILHAVN